MLRELVSRHVRGLPCGEDEDASEMASTPEAKVGFTTTTANCFRGNTRVPDEVSPPVIGCVTMLGTEE